MTAPRPSTIALALAVSVCILGCVGGIRGHAEVGTADRALPVGSIAAADSERSLHLTIEVTSGALRVELVDADGTTVWSATASESAPLDQDVAMAGGEGPWQARLVALEAPAVADYRIEIRPAR